MLAIRRLGIVEHLNYGFDDRSFRLGRYLPSIVDGFANQEKVAPTQLRTTPPIPPELLVLSGRLGVSPFSFPLASAWHMPL